MKKSSLLLAVLLFALTSTLQDFTFTDDFLNSGKSAYNQDVFSSGVDLHSRHSATAHWNDHFSFADSLTACNTNTTVTFSFLNMISWRSDCSGISRLLNGNSETNPPPGLFVITNRAI